MLFSRVWGGGRGESPPAREVAGRAAGGVDGLRFLISPDGHGGECFTREKKGRQRFGERCLGLRGPKKQGARKRKRGGVQEGASSENVGSPAPRSHPPSFALPYNPPSKRRTRKILVKRV